MKAVDVKFVLESIDKLAVALADKSHKWTNDERSSYEKSRVILLNEVGGSK